MCSLCGTAWHGLACCNVFGRRSVRSLRGEGEVLILERAAEAGLLYNKICVFVLIYRCAVFPAVVLLLFTTGYRIVGIVF